MAAAAGFADELGGRTGAGRGGGSSRMNKHIAKMKEKCRERAEKGFACAKVIFLDFLGDAKEMAEEAEMLGLEVVSAEKGGDTLFMKVQWPNAAGVRSVCRPGGLEAGNLRGTCKVCMTEETNIFLWKMDKNEVFVLCRTHPCGHLIGKNCAAALVGRNCAFCRTPVRMIHAVFEP
jgi:hypothetical protein